MGLDYIIAIGVGLFWSIFVLLQQIKLILCHRLSYFSPPKFHTAPKCLFNSSLGEHKMAKLKTIVLHYVESGDSNKPLMLFLHGFPDFWYTWRHQIAEFQATHRVVAVDMRGFGDSEKPQDVASYKMQNMVSDIKELLDYLNVERCTLVSHDWGGAVAYAFAAHHREMLDHLIVLNCPYGPIFMKTMRSSLKQFLCSWYMFFFQIPYLPEFVFERLDLAFIRKIFGSNEFKKPQAEDIEASIAMFSRPGALTSSINYYRAAFRYRPPMSTIKKASAIADDLPKLLIWGDKDMALTTQLAKNTVDALPGMQLKMIPGASHWVQQDAPDQVNAAIHNFLNQ